MHLLYFEHYLIWTLSLLYSKFRLSKIAFLYFLCEFCVSTYQLHVNLHCK